MDSTEQHIAGHWNADPAALATCIAPLDREGRLAVCRYWDRVVGEMAAGRGSGEVGYPAPFAAEMRREERERGRALARLMQMITNQSATAEAVADREAA